MGPRSQVRSPHKSHLDFQQGGLEKEVLLCDQEEKTMDLRMATFHLSQRGTIFVAQGYSRHVES